MKIQTAKAAAKVLEAMDQKTQQRMKRAIKAIPDGDIRPLIGTRSLFRLRVGNWRIVFYYLDEETIWIEKLRHAVMLTKEDYYIDNSNTNFRTRKTCTR